MPPTLGTIGFVRLLAPRTFFDDPRRFISTDRPLQLRDQRLPAPFRKPCERLASSQGPALEGSLLPLARLKLLTRSVFQVFQFKAFGMTDPKIDWIALLAAGVCAALEVSLFTRIFAHRRGGETRPG